jgi:GntR family transcriptional regulator
MFVLFRLDPLLGEPLYAQLANQVRLLIGKGSLQVGDRLPTIRDVSESLSINMHTVRQAYGILESEGLVETRRGRGVTVISTGTNRVEILARQFVAEARSAGIGNTEIRRILEAEL